jgi:hypothetical protein
MSLARCGAALAPGLFLVTTVACDAIDRQLEAARHHWAYGVIPPTSSGPGPWLSELPGGDRLEVGVVNSGCFHYETGTIVWETGSRPRLRVRAPDGATVKLPVDEPTVTSFDRWLQYLRAKHQGGCTTRVSVDVTWYRGSVVLDRSTYLDDSCGAPGLSAVKLMGVAEKLHGLRFDSPSSGQPRVP